MSAENQRRMRCTKCHGLGIYDKEADRFFCMDCGFDSKEERKQCSGTKVIEATNEPFL